MKVEKSKKEQQFHLEIIDWNKNRDNINIDKINCLGSNKISLLL